MAPLRSRTIVSKERFSSYFSTLKPQTYHDPGSRGPGSHVLRSIDWNPLGTMIATGASDKVLRVWNPERPNVRYSTELKGHEASIEKVAFNPTTESQLASLSNDGVMKLWDVRSRACVNEVGGLEEAFTMVWHPDGEGLIVGNTTNNLFFIDPAQKEPVSSHQQDVQTNQICFSWSGKIIYVTTGEGNVKVLQYPELTSVFPPRPGQEKPYTLNGHTSSCLSVALQPTARWLATGGSDSIIALWDTKWYQCHRTLIDMVGPIRSISFSFDGMYIVGGSDEGTGLEIAHVETGEYVHSVKTSGPCPIVAWHPHRYHLAYTDISGLKIIQADASSSSR